jgi:hypothetical protein
LERRECICQRYGGNGILDHARLWRTPEGETVLTGEPYHLDPEAFVAFVAECTELGLKVWVSGRSSYYPGATVLVEVRRVTPPEPSALPRERTTAAERRAMMSRRVCFVCRETIPESGAVLHSYAHVMACVGECSSVMESHARDYTRSRRGRLRSAGEVRRLVDKEMGR